jgi:predicted transposase YdaD
MSHDQNYKNLILDYPRESLAFFAQTEAQAIDPGARIVPIREEQLKERLGERFRELDVPLLVEWGDGRRSALLFVLEEETNPNRFSIHRLAHYCLDLSELFSTDRVVPVVIFLHRGSYPEQLCLGSENRDYLHFSYLYTALFSTPAQQYINSQNIVARLTLPCMKYAPQDKLEIYAAATRGLMELESDPELQLKYADFIDIYTALDENELIHYQQHYAKEAKAMTALSARMREEGMQQGMQQGILQGIQQGIQQGMQQGIQQGVQQGMQQGMQHEARMLLERLLSKRFGALGEETHLRLQNATLEQLNHWVDRILDASTLSSVFDGH